MQGRITRQAFLWMLKGESTCGLRMGPTYCSFIRPSMWLKVQDGAIGHVADRLQLVLGDDISVGHGAIIHGCRIGNGTLIGMGAILLNGVEIGEYALVGAGSIVTENKKIPPLHPFPRISGQGSTGTDGSRSAPDGAYFRQLCGERERIRNNINSGGVFEWTK